MALDLLLSQLCFFFKKYVLGVVDSKIVPLQYVQPQKIGLSFHNYGNSLSHCEMTQISFCFRNLSVQVSDGNLADCTAGEHWSGDRGPQPKRAKVRDVRCWLLCQVLKWIFV